PRNAENFPSDVAALNGYLTDRSLIPGVRAVPGAGTNVPLYLLGSSLFRAQLPAPLGLPYSFASRFAPAALEPAASVYRANCRAPSPPTARPPRSGGPSAGTGTPTGAPLGARSLVRSPRSTPQPPIPSLTRASSTSRSAASAAATGLPAAGGP